MRADVGLKDGCGEIGVGDKLPVSRGHQKGGGWHSGSRRLRPGEGRGRCDRVGKIVVCTRQGVGDMARPGGVCASVDNRYLLVDDTLLSLPISQGLAFDTLQLS